MDKRPYGKGMEGLTEYEAVAEFVFNDILDKAGETASPAASPAAAPPVMAAPPAPSPV